MKRVIVVVMLLLLIPIGCIVIRFGSAITQEGNPIPYLISIAKYELSNNKYEKVLETTNTIRYVSYYEKQNPLGRAIEFMKNEGWDFKEQIGSGLVFEKNKEIITINTRQYSKHYFIWDVPREGLN